MNVKQEVVRSGSQVQLGESLHLRLYEGKLETKVEKVEEHG